MESQRKRRKSVVRKKLFKTFNKVMKSGTLHQAWKSITKKSSKQSKARKEN